MIARLLGVGIIGIALISSSHVADQYGAPKWAVVYLVAGLVGILASLNFRIPRIGIFTPLILALILLYCGSMALSWPGAYENHLVDLFTWFSLTLGSFTILSREGMWSRLMRYHKVALVLVFLYSGLQWFGYEPHPSVFHDGEISSFFGIRNAAAEFIGLSFTLLFLSGFLSLLILPILYVFWKLENRAALLGLGSALVTIFYQLKHLPKIWRVRLILIFVTLIGVATWIAAGKRDYPFSTRLGIWRNTVTMISEHPLGVGPGNFEFVYPLYRAKGVPDHELSEERIVRSPHNGYLELVAECGFPLAILFLFTVLLFLFELRAYGARGRVVIGGMVFLLVDALFAFPMEMPYPFFMSAVLVGYGFSLLNQDDNWSLYGNHGDGFLPAFCAFFALMGGAFITFSQAQVGTDHRKSMEVACEFTPSVWRVCLSSAMIKIQDEDWSGAEKVLREMVDLNPGNYQAVKWLMIVLYEQDKKEQSCKLVKYYDDLFGGKSSFHGIYQEKCSGV